MDIARTQGQIRATNAGKAELAAKGEKEPGKGASKEDWAAYNEKLTNTSSYKTAQAEWGTGSAIQQGMQAATAAIQGLAGGDLKAAIAGGASPYLAEMIKVSTQGNEAARVTAHAIVAGVLAEMQGNNALAGAAGAATAAASTNVIAKAMYGTDDFSKMTEEQLQTVSALTTLASGLAGGLAGGDSGSAIAGGQAGKNTAENNDMSTLIPLGIQQDASLAFWMAQQGSSPEEINQAVADSHLGPSFGVTYKVKPYVKGEVAVGAGYGFYADGTIEHSQLSLNSGETLAIGGRAAGQVGIQLGPYYPNLIAMEKITL
ncbi:TPA: polymorphic toxin type 25 domain-containing protein [Serratia odorifera]|nr:VENN motif pre-toxin domain-containing protein [Serratia odorifera]